MGWRTVGAGALLADASHRDSSICDGLHVFCDDFDRRPVGATPDWGEAPTIDANGSVKVRSFADALSPPNVLESRVAGGGNAFLSTSIQPASGKHGVRCSFGYQIIAINQADTLATVGLMRLVTGNETFIVDLRYDALLITAVLGDGGPGSSPSLTNVSPPSAGAWKRVAISMAIGDGADIRVEIDGAVVAKKATGAVAPTVQSAQLRLGVESFSSTANWQVVYDDVVCDVLE